MLIDSPVIVLANFRRGGDGGRRVASKWKFLGAAHALAASWHRKTPRARLPHSPDPKKLRGFLRSPPTRFASRAWTSKKSLAVPVDRSHLIERARSTEIEARARSVAVRCRAGAGDASPGGGIMLPRVTFFGGPTQVPHLLPASAVKKRTII